MQLSSLTAISPIDGRYGSKTADLRTIFGEYGLIKYRVLVEVRWLQQLAEHPAIKEVKTFNSATQAALEQLAQSFDESAAQRIKDIEKSHQSRR